MTEELPPEAPAPQEKTAPEPATKAPAGVLRGDKGTDAAQIIMSAFLILVIGAIAYLNTFGVPFQGLEQQYILDNPAIQRIQTVPQAETGPVGAPLTQYSYALNWRFVADSVWGFRFLDLLLHLANSMLLYLICRRLFRGTLPEPIAMLAGMLFAVHPLASDAVVYLAGRPALLSTFFALLTLLLWLRATQRDTASLGTVAAALVCYALAFASSFALLLLPLLLIGADLATGALVRLRRHAPLHAIFLAALFLLLAAQLGTQMAAEAPPADGEGGATTALSQATLRLVSQAAMPLQLHPLPVEPGFSMAGLGLFLVLAAGAVAALFASSIAGLALLWTCAALTGAAFMLPADAATTERSLYFALAGLCLLVPWVLSLLEEPLSRKVAGGVAAVLILAAAATTFARATVWQDPEELWTHASEARPDSPEPWRYLGRYVMRASRTVQDEAALAPIMGVAADYWERVLDFDATDKEALVGLGMANFGRGQHEAAVQHLSEALRHDPFNQQASIFLAMALEEQAEAEGDSELLRRAVDHYAHARHLGHLSNEMFARDAFARMTLGDVEGALPTLAQLAEINPESPAAAALHQLAPVTERIAALEQQAQAQLAETPAALGPHLLRAEAQLLRGDQMGAYYLSDRVLRRDPEQQEAWALHGAIAARLGRQETFLERWGEARPAELDTWRTLALRTASLGAWPGALHYLEFAATRLPEAPLPRVTLAEIALRLHQPHLAQNYLQQAAELHAENPTPWLVLADMALAAEQEAQAQQFLGEAQRRGATEEALRQRSEDVEIPDPDAPRRPPRMIIR